MKDLSVNSGYMLVNTLIDTLVNTLMDPIAKREASNTSEPIGGRP